MTRLRRFLILPSAERRLLLKAMLVVQFVKMGAGLLPFRVLRRLLARACQTARHKPPAGARSADRVAWAVGVASQHTLGPTTCLIEGLAGQVMLAAEGYPARLHLGVTRGEGGGLGAHAWVECGGRIVIGGSAGEVERYTPLLALDAEMS